MQESMRHLSSQIRIETIRALAAAGYGHIGGAMSIADVLGVLYGGVMRVKPADPAWEERDRLILSKGHAGPALYAALAISGYFPIEWLSTINKPGTKLPSHCDMRKTPGIDMTTGSLGQGISCAAGIALGNKMKGRDSYTYCIIGDGEMQEGQVWEAVQAAASLKLDHLILFVDCNKKQLDGLVADVCLDWDVQAQFSAFGWNARTATGWDTESIYAAVQECKKVSGKPSVILLDTIKGIGCSFAENVFNHYMDITPEMCEAAIAEIGKRLENGTYPQGDQK
jgi:transketolase